MGNGRMYCNLEGLEVVIDRTARWYVIALGTDDAFVSPRWYGHAPTVDGRRPNTLLVQPGTSVSAEVKHNNYGLWLVEDQTADHAHAGAAHSSPRSARSSACARSPSGPSAEW